MIDFENVDCFEKMTSMENNSIDLIMTDPPYGISFKGQTSNTDWDNMTDEEYSNFLFHLFFEFERILKDDGTIWLCCGRTKIPIVFDVLKKFDNLNLNLDNWLTYVRAKGRGSKNKLKSQCEEILHISKGKNYKWNSVEYLREVVVPYIKDGKPRGWMIDQNTGMRVRWSGVGNALFFTSPFFKNKFEPQIHSTQKPFLLWVELLMISSDKDDVVFDPFSGSCSSGIACSVCGRNYIGCEIDKDMYDKANEWLNNYDKELVKEYIGSRIRRNEESLFDM